jgi:hypothetical protein
VPAGTTTFSLFGIGTGVPNSKMWGEQTRLLLCATKKKKKAIYLATVPVRVYHWNYHSITTSLYRQPVGSYSRETVNQRKNVSTSTS